MNTLENTITTMGLLSKEAYNVENFQIGAEITANNQTYKVIDYANTTNDFQALLLKNESGKFVMAFRGTELDSILDWLNDVSIGLANINEQYNDAKEFLEKAMKDYGVTIDNLTLTGHSLGGILTQQVGATYGIKGYAFNPYGTDRLLSLPSSLSTGIASNILLEKVMSAVGLTKANAQWAYEHIYNISYQDEGALNGDILSNFATELSSNHLGHFIPILGENVGFGKGHYMETLNKAISQYNDIVQKFDNSCRYEDITNMYLSTAIIHGNGYEKVKEEFTKLGVYGANDNSLHLEVITKDTDTTSIFSGSNLSTPALYALVNLNPFIVSGVNSNAYAELEKYKDEYSKNYVSDKAKMFKALMDTPKVGSYYDDYETGKKISYYTSVTDPDSTDEYNLTDTAYTFGTNKNDIVTASVGKANRIYTLAGDDTITLTSGSNYIEAGSGNDTIDLSGIKDTNSVNTIYADIKDSKDDKDSGDDIIIGSSGKDTMYGGAGNDKYYAGNGDTIEDDDKGEGSVYFNSNSPLTGGTYDKDRDLYISDDYIEYKLHDDGRLVVSDMGENIVIENFNKDNNDLGIILIDPKDVVVTIHDNQANEGGNGKHTLGFKVSLNRKLEAGEYLTLYINGQLVKFTENEQEKDNAYIYKWDGNESKDGDRKFEVSASVVTDKSIVKAKLAQAGNETIIDDDREFANLNLLVS